MMLAEFLVTITWFRAIYHLANTHKLTPKHLDSEDICHVAQQYAQDCTKYPHPLLPKLFVRVTTYAEYTIGDIPAPDHN